MKLTEQQIEDVFEQFHGQLIEPGLVFKGRQVTLENRLRVDLYFQDKQKKNVIVELKRDPVSREDVGQLFEYRGAVENSRVILVAPFIASAIKTAFEHYGIQYIEFSKEKVSKLYRQIKSKPRKAQAKTAVAIPTGTISEPLSERTLRDGNIAFKVSYNDKNWSGICSPDIYEYNAETMFWCGQQAPNCQEFEDELGTESYPCYDSIALKEMSFTPAWNHGRDRPHVCRQAKVGKIALLTSREPGEPESSRFVFGIFEIQKLTRRHPANTNHPGTEYYWGDKGTALALTPKQYLPLWEYHSNPNAPETVHWGTGLFRYVKDAAVRGILKEISTSRKSSKTQKKNARALLKKVS